jgi:hypothetical protein
VPNQALHLTAAACRLSVTSRSQKEGCSLRASFTQPTSLSAVKRSRVDARRRERDEPAGLGWPMGPPRGRGHWTYVRNAAVAWKLKPFPARASETDQKGRSPHFLAGRPPYLSEPVRKEDLARKIAECDGIGEGLVCVSFVLEPCQTWLLQGAARADFAGSGSEPIHLVGTTLGHQPRATGKDLAAPFL